MDLTCPALSSRSTQQEPGKPQEQQSHPSTSPEHPLPRSICLLLSVVSSLAAHSAVESLGEPQQSPVSALGTFSRLFPVCSRGHRMYSVGLSSVVLLIPVETQHTRYPRVIHQAPEVQTLWMMGQAGCKIPADPRNQGGERSTALRKPLGSCPTSCRSRAGCEGRSPGLVQLRFEGLRGWRPGYRVKLHDSAGGKFVLLDLAGSSLAAAFVCGLWPFPCAPPEQPSSRVPVTPVGSSRCDLLPLQLFFSGVTKASASAMVTSRSVQDSGSEDFPEDSACSGLDTGDNSQPAAWTPRTELRPSSINPNLFCWGFLIFVCLFVGLVFLYYLISFKSSLGGPCPLFWGRRSVPGQLAMLRHSTVNQWS